MDDIIDVDSPEARIAMRRRHLELGLRMQAVGVHALEELEQKIAAGKPLDMSSEDAKKLFDSGATMERLALGEHDDGDDAPIPPVPPRKPS